MFRSYIKLNLILSFILLLFIKVSGQDKFIEDSVYFYFLKMANEDSSKSGIMQAIILLNRAAEKAKLNPSHQDDTITKYYKLTYEEYPHECHFLNYVNDKKLVNHFEKEYIKGNPLTVDLMRYYRDSLESSYHKDIQAILTKLVSDDQRDRLSFDRLISRGNVSRKTIDRASVELDNNDHERMFKIDSLIQIYGYPGKSLVGFNYSDFAWLILQHSESDKLINYLPIVQQAMDQGEMGKSSFAYFVDRYLVSNGRKQIFGNQYYTKKNNLYFFPIGDPANLDSRRANFGLNPHKLYVKFVRKELKESKIQKIR